MSEQRDLFRTPSARSKAEHRRDVGMERAGDHADRKTYNWKDRAAALIGQYASFHGSGHEFLIEDVVSWDSRLRLQLPDPPDGRAWGAAGRC